jgi:hypothetical protein
MLGITLQPFAMLQLRELKAMYKDDFFKATGISVEPRDLRDAIWFSPTAGLERETYGTLPNFNDGARAPLCQNFVWNLSKVQDKVRAVRHWCSGQGTRMKLHVECTAMGPSNKVEVVRKMREAVQRTLLQEFLSIGMCCNSLCFGKDGRKARDGKGPSGRKPSAFWRAKERSRDHRGVLQILALDEENEVLRAAVVHILGPALAYLDLMTIRLTKRFRGCGHRFATAILAVVAACNVDGIVLEATAPVRPPAGMVTEGKVVSVWAGAGFEKCADEPNDISRGSSQISPGRAE